MRLSGRHLVALAALVGLVIVFATDQIAPASDPYRAQMRIWLAARASGFIAYGLVTLVVSLGLILSHPVNLSTWRLSKTLFPWHENLFAFTIAFVAVHVVTLILDPYAGVGVLGAFIPGLSSYRTVPVAVGTIALYALLVSALTARYVRLLPAGMWLRIHRFSIVVWALAWAHGILAGTDTDATLLVYVVSGLLILLAASYRYWVSRQRRPVFATSLPQGGHEGLTVPAVPLPADARSVPHGQPPGIERGPAAPMPSTEGRL